VEGKEGAGAYPTSAELKKAAERRKRYARVRNRGIAGTSSGATSDGKEGGTVSWNEVTQSAAARVARVTRGGGVPNVERGRGGHADSTSSSAVRRAAGMSAARRSKGSGSPSNDSSSSKPTIKAMAPAVLGMSETMKSSLSAPSNNNKKKTKSANQMMRRGGGVRHHQQQKTTQKHEMNM
jgi:hypothetical protein